MSSDSSSVAVRLGEAVLNLVSSVPPARELASSQPADAAWQLAQRAARKAGVAAGTLALPPGPLGWLTILPELVAVWRIQAQMVADIAAIYGTQHAPTREQMLYCLFRHTAAQAVRDLAVRMGQRVLVKEAGAQVLQSVAGAIGLHLSQRALGHGVSRWVPVAGAVGVGAYAWHDTRQVAKQAMALFDPQTASTASPAAD